VALDTVANRLVAVNTVTFRRLQERRASENHAGDVKVRAKSPQRESMISFYAL
jgi:hypothetical protein